MNRSKKASPVLIFSSGPAQIHSDRQSTDQADTEVHTPGENDHSFRATSCRAQKQWSGSTPSDHDEEAIQPAPTTNFNSISPPSNNYESSGTSPSTGEEVVEIEAELDEKAEWAWRW